MWTSEVNKLTLTHNHLNVQQTAGAAILYFFSDGSCKIFVLNHGSPSHGPPDCIMQPAATFVNYVHTIKITQNFRQFGITLIVISSLVA
jgi:hypothetical protein